MTSPSALIIDADPATAQRFEDVVRRLGLEPVHVVAGADALEYLQTATPAVVIVDLEKADVTGPLLGRLTASGQIPVIAIAESAGVRTAVRAMRAGAIDVLDKQADAREIEQAIRAVLPKNVGRGRTLCPIDSMIARVAALSAPVLIRGESGVGKEAVATAIHRRSDRSDGPFRKIRCGTPPGDVVDAQLMSMATDAQGGTLFLDEVDGASPTAQAHILRVLTGSTGVRVLAAATADMYALVAGGTFRRDLYERLSVATIDVPPLRARREEIDALVHHFLERFAGEFGRPIPSVSPSMAELLRAYEWPGNVRELENLVKRWVVLGAEDDIRTDLDARRTALLRTEGATSGKLLGLRDIARRAAREAERVALEQALRLAKGNRAAVARQMRVSYKTLLHKLVAVGLSSTPRGNRNS